jgi:hypothetical protein
MRLMSICGLTALSLGLTQGTGRAYGGYGSPQQQQFVPQQAPPYDACQAPQAAPVIVQQAPQVIYRQAVPQRVVVQRAPVVYRQRSFVQQRSFVPQQSFVQQAPVVGSGGGLNVGRKVRIKIKKSPGASVGF